MSILPVMRVQVQGIESLIKELRQMDDRGKAVLNDVALEGAQYAAPLLSGTIPRSPDNKHIKDKVKVKLNKRKTKYKSMASVTIGSAAKGFNYAFHYETGHKMTLADGSIKYVPPAKTVRRKFDQIKGRIADKMRDTFIAKAGGN